MTKVICNFCDKEMEDYEDTLPKNDPLNLEAVFRCKDCRNRKEPLFV